MEETFQQEETEQPQPTGVSASLLVLNSFIERLVKLIHPTKEEQEEAGVYLGGEGRS